LVFNRDRVRTLLPLNNLLLPCLLSPQPNIIFVCRSDFSLAYNTLSHSLLICSVSLLCLSLSLSLSLCVSRATRPISTSRIVHRCPMRKLCSTMTRHPLNELEIGPSVEICLTTPSRLGGSTSQETLVSKATVQDSHKEVPNRPATIRVLVPPRAPTKSLFVATIPSMVE
jgi:hypothetical protein